LNYLVEVAVPVNNESLYAYLDGISYFSPVWSGGGGNISQAYSHCIMQAVEYNALLPLGLGNLLSICFATILITIRLFVIR